MTYTDLLTMNIFGDLEVGVLISLALTTMVHQDLEGAFSDPSSWVPSTVRGRPIPGMRSFSTSEVEEGLTSN